MFGISLTIRLIVTALFGIFFAGCQQHDIDYFPDPIPKGEGEYSISSQESKASDQVWWAAFDDPKLDLLIREAIVNNYDVMQAVARLTQASSLTRQAKAKSPAILHAPVSPCLPEDIHPLLLSRLPEDHPLPSTGFSAHALA